jgi:membrane protease subunit HflK
MWKISMAENFLFNLQDPEETIKVAAESVMRGIIGQTKIESALTDAKESIQSEARTKLQELVDDYGAGIEIRDVQLLSVNPPSEDVIDAFNDVQRARQEKSKLINEAEAFFNDVVPRARGESAQLVAQAEAYSAEIVNRAKGDASRFNDIYKSYLMSKDVTIERIYLETFEEILGNVNKVIIDTEVSQSGVLPFLPLPELNNKNRTVRSGGN